jgi:hypothetical protein
MLPWHFREAPALKQILGCGTARFGRRRRALVGYAAVWCIHEITVESRIGEFNDIVGKASAKEQYSAAVAALTAKAKLAGLWVDRAENLNGNYAISDKPLTEQEWVEKHVHLNQRT